jgi:hypothetical protein
VDKYIYRLGSHTNHIGSPPRFYKASNINNGLNKFASVYSITGEDAFHIQEAQTAAGFRGTVWSRRLWIDIDTAEAATAAKAKVKELGYDHVVYDTGNRGCHIGIARDALPSHTLPQQDKAWVQANIVGADLSLYWHLHLIRLPGVLHEKTGKPKRLIYSQEGKILALQPWVQASTNNMGGTSGQAPSGTPLKRVSIFKTWEVMQHFVPTGHRRQLVELAVALHRAQVTKEEALWVVRELNRAYTVPKDENDLLRIVDWAYNEV